MTAQYADICTFLTSVARVEPVTPEMVRITARGGDLAEFEPIGPDQFVYLLLPPPGARDLTIDRSFGWEHYRTMPGAARPVGAYYTVRHWRPECAEVDLDVVLHAGGHVSDWAARARVGDAMALWGPRRGYEPPADLRWQLLVADETGLPAVGAILEATPAGVTTRAVIEVADYREEQPLAIGPRVEVSWIHRNGGAPGRSCALLDAVRGCDLPADAYVWGAGESRLMTAIRMHVRRDRGLAARAVSVVGYWRLADDDE